MLLPIGHEKDTVRRLPWVTFSIIGICFLAHIFISTQVREARTELQNSLREYIEYYVLHPYLVLDPEINKQIFGEEEAEGIDALLSLYQHQPPKNPLVLGDEQEKLDELADKFKNGLKNFPYRKWGYIPARPTMTGLFTYMFVHAGWLHLLGNLLFLYLTGPFIEDVWGRGFFAGFYILMGFISAFLFGQIYPGSNVPLIGASGAIAGVMGAFLVRYWFIKIDFLFLIIVIKVARFKAPTWVMLPLWFLLELYNARVVDQLNPSGGSGVAHWAHVFGFAFGVATGIGMKIFNVEKKYITPKIDSKTGYVDDGLEIVTQALGKKKSGFFEEAYDMLRSAVEKYPSNTDVVETFWEASIEVGQESTAAPFMAKLLEKEIRQDQMDAAFDHFLKLKEKLSSIPIGVTYKLTLFHYFIDRTDMERAKSLAEEISPDLNTQVSPKQLTDFFEKAAAIHPAAAYKALSVILQHSEITEEEKNKLRTRHAELEKHFQQQAKPDTSGESDQIGQESLHEIPGEPLKTSPEKHLKIFKGIPLGVKDDKLLVSLEESGKKFLPMQKVKVIAAVEILSHYEDPYVVIDLFLDDIYSQTENIRTVRLVSSEFHAPSFFQKPLEPREAVRAFVAALLDLSGAIPHPDRETVLLSPPKRLPDIKEYDRLLLETL
ncbi:MAG: rhomboid family intramembrane serine protease [Candidatus Aminicenantes bacterium]|nr:rhomboid family intramembrane serine protease [Candidatus Aminicenantes bacterium]